MMISIGIVLAVGLIAAACAVIAALVKRGPEPEDNDMRRYVDQD